MMRTPSRSKSIRKPQELLFPDHRENLRRHTFDDLVFQRRYPQGSLPSVCFRNIDSPNGSRPVRSSPQPLRQIPKVLFQVLPVVLPCLSIYPCRRITLQPVIRLSQMIDVVNMVIERGEFGLPISPYCLTYALQSLLHPFLPALRPEDGTLSPIPLGRWPSLHPLRPLRFVRRFLRYYATVRLPMPVHHWLIPSGFPTRPTPWADMGSPSSCAKCFHTCAGSQTAQSQCQTRLTSDTMLPSDQFDIVGALELCFPFHGSIPDLHAPRSTLRLDDCSSQRMTWGRSGLLNLDRIGLSPTTPCQFVLAHRTMKMVCSIGSYPMLYALCAMLFSN